MIDMVQATCVPAESECDHPVNSYAIMSDLARGDWNDLARLRDLVVSGHNLAAARWYLDQMVDDLLEVHNAICNHSKFAGVAAQKIMAVTDLLEIAVEWIDAELKARPGEASAVHDDR